MIYFHYICLFFSMDVLRLADSTPVYKKMIGIKKKAIGLLLFYLLYLRYLNVAFLIKLTKVLTRNQLDYRKGCSSQHLLISVSEK